MAKFTEEAIERANQVDLLALAERQGYDLKKVGRSYKVTGLHLGGLEIDPENNRWYNHSTRKGGGPIQWMMDLQQMDWKTAVGQLSGEENLFVPQQKRKTRAAEEEKMQLPPELKRTSNQRQRWNTCWTYLVDQRGLSPVIVTELMNQGQIMFTKPFLWEKHKNDHILFIGRDDSGEARYAFKRTPHDGEYKFGGELKGSKKEYSFSIAGKGDKLYAFEAPIDLISFLSLKEYCNDRTDHHYLSLAGLTDKALNHFLTEHPEIKEVVFCLDNDRNGSRTVFDRKSKQNITVPYNHGQEATKEIGEGLKARGYTVKRMLPPNGKKDWNESLVDFWDRKKAAEERRRNQETDEVIEEVHTVTAKGS